MGHDVVYAKNGRECLEAVYQTDFDLILLDVEMPELDGVGAAKAIREFKQEDWFPIIFFSSHEDDDSFCNGILAGGDAYLTKPLNPLRLQLTVIAMERIYVMRRKLKRTQLALETANKQLERLSLHDSLTGLANRRCHDITLDNLFIQAKRHKSPLSMIICDVDYFKNYNDAYGHQQGDACLAWVAKSIKAQLENAADLACRYGGEEFTVILPDTNLQAAADLADKIRISIFDGKNPHCQSKVGEYVSLSLGVSTYIGQFHSGSELTKAADAALYLAKERGRNRVEVSMQTD